MFNRSRLDFLKKSTIYEVNLRQYTSEGTIRAFMEHLPRLKDMGVDVIWLMPIHPIGKLNRKGSLGSYYSISDYKRINPEYGSLEDFAMLVEKVHKLDMKIIIDWVANHASWDNVWTIEHPEYFCRDENGNFLSPYDWSDVIQFDHSNMEAHLAQTEAMCYWVRNYDIDGFRADLAHLTPLGFWIRSRMETEKIKPGLIWLAETEDVGYYEAFDVNYAWKWMHATERYAKKPENLSVLYDTLTQQNQETPSGLFQLYFTSNHDENTWNGTEFEKYGRYADAYAVFSFFYVSSIPLIYSGQEIPNEKRIAFFDKDELIWNRNDKHDFYKKLIACRKQVCGSAEFCFMPTEGNILGLRRGSEENHVLVFMNLGVEAAEFQHPLPNDCHYKNVMTGQINSFGSHAPIKLNPGDFLVLQRV